MKTVPRGLLTVSAVLLLLVVIGGSWFFRTQEQQMRHQVETQLQGIAHLKVDQVIQWRQEQVVHAHVIAETPFATVNMANWLTAPDPVGADRILAWFRTLQKYYQYGDILLVDPQGTIRLSLSGQDGTIEASGVATLTEAARQRRPMLSDLSRIGDGQPYLDTIAPIMAEGGLGVVGGLVLRIDADRFLYPLIQRWPGPSESAETLLVRRDGDQVLFLNELRHQQQTALRLRIPLVRAEVPAVMAVTGVQGVVAGRDYRGVEVFSVLSSIPDTPWRMVTKINTDEVMAEWRARSWLIAGLFLGLAVAVMTALGLAWQRHAKKQYQAAFRAETERRQAEARYRTTLMSIGDGVIASDNQGRVTLLNPVAEVLTGWLEADARGRSIEEVFVIVNESTRQPVENPVDRVLREGIVVGLANHTILITRTGGEYPIADSGAPIFDDQGRITGAVLVFRDQTEERQAASALWRSNHLLARAEEMADMGCWEFDFQTRTVWASSAACRIYGLQDAPWTIEAAQSIPLPEYRNALNRALKALVQGEAPYDVEFRIQRPTDGALLDIRSQAEYKPEEDKVFGVIHDITGRKQAEEQQERLREQLLQAQKLESVGRLAGGVAHDLNNMLTPILGYSEVLLSDLDETDTRRNYVQYIVQAGMRARDLVRQLLAFGRKQTLMVENVDLNGVTAGFVQLLLRTVREDIAIEVVPAPALPWVRVDTGQIEQVIMNLVVNAQDALPDGGKILIETEAIELDEDYAASHVGVVPGPFVVLTVTDTGCGMETSVREQIFAPFFTTKEQGKGTGLGLAMVYGIVKQHGGHIWVYSEPGQGTTFKIYLPAVESSVESKVQGVDVLPERSVGGTETVMVVEDNDMVRQLTVDILTRRGYRVLVAVGGAACLELLAAHTGPVDLLVTDVVMPEINGKMLYKQVAERIPGIKVLYMSGYTENVIASRGVLDQSVNFIQKPFAPNSLAAKVREVLAG